MLERVSADDFAGVPKDIGYLNTLVNLGLVAIALGDRARAECLYGLLAPYPHHNAPTKLLYYEGSVSHYLALLAEFLGERPRAQSHFDDALAMNEITWTRGADGTVRQLWRVTKDGGKTWTTAFDGKYVRSSRPQPK